MQPELFGPPPLKVNPPKGRRAPRLWIRRFAIWKEPDEAPTRDHALGPGLNIIWSPDPVDRSANDTSEAPAGPGHGAGKTLVCRLFRYCLGERHFAPDELRAKVSNAFLNGRVGVEVVLDGAVWAIVRSIGISPHDVAIESGTLEQAVSANPTGLHTFVQKLADTFITPVVAALIADKPFKAWQNALGWLIRDQEAHFARAMVWRASGGPNITEATNIIRALIGAITPKEFEIEAEIARLDKERKEEEAGVERRRGLIEATVRRLLTALGLEGQTVPGGDFQGLFLRNAARDRVAKVAAVDLDGDLAPVDDLEAAYDEARAKVERLVKALTLAESKASRAQALIQIIERETPGLAASIDDAIMPICPVCEVPIDRALAEGCKLSRKLADLDSLKARRERNARERDQHRRDQQEAEEEAQRLHGELTEATRARDVAKTVFQTARKLHTQREDIWYVARRASDDVSDVERLIEENDGAARAVARLVDQLEKLRDEVKQEREQHKQVFTALGRHFDPLVRKLLGDVPGTKGRIEHDGNGLRLVVEYGGDCDATAIQLVEVLAFDLATLCRSMEGATHLPALLIHDSPRASDLGLSLYWHLFRLARDLEDVGEGPQFQYIVTTTSRPPDDLVNDPRLRMKLMGSPAESRLLGKDL